MVGTNVSIFVRLLLYVIWPELRLVGDRAWALEDEVRGRANEKSGAKTKKRRERDSGEETGVRGGSEAGHSGVEVAGVFSLTLAVLYSQERHPSIKLSLSHCPFQSISR
jgi:hypothetical protein